MRSVGAFAIRLEAKPVGERFVHAAERLEAIASPKPDDPRRAALGKEPEAIECDGECRLRERLRESIAHPLLHRIVHVTQKVQGEVHTIGADPRRFRVRLDSCADTRRYPFDLRARPVVYINRNK